MLTLAAILCIIIFAPLAMGSVYIITYSLMGGIVFTVLGVHVAKGIFGKNTTIQNWAFTDKRFLILSIPFILFLFVGCFQIIPLPAGLLRFLSPGTYTMYGKLGIDQTRMLPITLSTALTTFALFKWCLYGGLFLLLVTCKPNFGDVDDLRWLLIPAHAIFAIGLTESVYGLYGAVNHSESLLWFGRTHNVGVVSGTYINSDHLAGLLDMAIPVSIGLLLYHGGMLYKKVGHSKTEIIALLGSKRALGMWVLSLGILIMIVAHIFTLSRMGHISIIVAFALVSIFYSKRKFKTPIVVTVTLLSGGLLWAVWEGMSVVIAKWGGLENNFLVRYEIWKGVLSLFVNFPTIGTGLGTFKLAFPPYKTAGFGTTIYDHAHNDYIEMLADAGLAGFVPWIIFFSLVLIFVIRDWFRNDSFLSKTLGAGCIAAVIGVLFHSLADFNLQIPANAAIFFVVMGITWRMVTQKAHFNSEGLFSNRKREPSSGVLVIFDFKLFACRHPWMDTLKCTIARRILIATSKLENEK